MPRRIDLTERNATDWEEALLPVPVYGEREITDGEIEALADAFKRPVEAFWPQFTTSGVSNPRDCTDGMAAAHAWLSEHATGPWLWHERWGNHGHSLDVHVYVERLTDQASFAKAHSRLFRYRPDEPGAHLRLAVVRGALPDLTARESFNRWTDENRGFEYLPYKDLGEHGVRVAIGHPAIEAGFRDAFGDRFRPDTYEGRACYVGSTEGMSWRDGPTRWLSGHAAVGDMSGGPGRDGGYVVSIKARYPDTIEALRRDWGHHFTLAADGTTFEASDFPKVPQRVVPEDFAAYLAGERDDHEAPHLPVAVVDFRAGSASPAIA